MSTSFGSGWTCGQCGAFVPYNTSHSCSGFGGGVPKADPTWMLLNALNDVKFALQRIAAALEKAQSK